MKELRGIFEIFGEFFILSLRNYASLIPDLVEPVLSVSVKGVLYLINAVFGNRVDYPYFYYAPVFVIILMFGIFLVGKLFSSVGASKSVAMIPYSRLEIILSLILIFVRTFYHFKGARFLYFTKYEQTLSGGGFSERFSYWICVYGFTILFFLLSLIAWYFVSCFWFAAFGYQQNFLQYPFMSFFGEIIKTLIYFGLLCISLFVPTYAFPIWGIMVVITIILYPYSYRMLEYFYFQDILTFRYTIQDHGKAKLHTGKKYVPKELKNLYPDRDLCVAFMIVKDKISERHFRKYDKVFATYENNSLILYQKQFLKKEFTKISIPKDEFFFISGHENFALFTINGPKEEIVHLFKKPKRDFCIYISKASETGFKEIALKLNVIDYEALSKELIKNKKLY